MRGILADDATLAPLAPLSATLDAGHRCATGALEEPTGAGLVLQRQPRPLQPFSRATHMYSVCVPRQGCRRCHLLPLSRHQRKGRHRSRICALTQLDPSAFGRRWRRRTQMLRYGPRGGTVQRNRPALLPPLGSYVRQANATQPHLSFLCCVF